MVSRSLTKRTWSTRIGRDRSIKLMEGLGRPFVEGFARFPNELHNHTLLPSLRTWSDFNDYLLINVILDHGPDNR